MKNRDDYQIGVLDSFIVLLDNVGLGHIDMNQCETLYSSLKKICPDLEKCLIKNSDLIKDNHLWENMRTHLHVQDDNGNRRHLGGQEDGLAELGWSAK
jgi:hypothetical protein